MTRDDDIEFAPSIPRAALEPIADTVRDELAALFADHACKACGVVGEYQIRAGTPPHWAGAWCQCGQFVRWLPKPQNETDRRDQNRKHRAHWTDHYQGDLGCSWCLARQSVKRCSFVVDHITPLERGGPDVVENTRIVCDDCHRKRHAELDAVQHLLGRSARDHDEAA